MSVSEPMSEQDMRDAFEDFIANPSGGVPSDCGFNAATEAALLTVLKNPNSQFAVSLARSRFEAQLLQKAGQELEDTLIEAFRKSQAKKQG